MSTNKIVGWKYCGRNAKIQSHLRYRKGTDLGNWALKSAPERGGHCGGGLGNGENGQSQSSRIPALGFKATAGHVGATEKKKLSEVESYKKQRLTLAIRYCRSHLPVFCHFQ